MRFTGRLALGKNLYVKLISSVNYKTYLSDLQAIFNSISPDNRTNGASFEAQSRIPSQILINPADII